MPYLLILLTLTNILSINAIINKPNILFIAIDDLRPEIAGPYGQPQIHTPNLQQLANQSTTFIKAYCQVALCSPSRTSLLTGLRPDTSKVWTIGPYFRTTMGHLGNKVITLPQYFKQHGYRTTGVGKIFHPGMSSGGPSKSEGGGDGGYPFRANGSWSKPYFFCDQFYNGTFQSPKAQQWPHGSGCIQSLSCIQCLKDQGGLKPTTKPVWFAASCPDNCFPDGAVADEAVRQLNVYGASNQLNHSTQPFFLAVGFKRPHLGWFGPKKYFDLYKNDPTIRLAKHRLPPLQMPHIAFSGNGEICGMDGVNCTVVSNISTNYKPYQIIPDMQHLPLRKAYYSVVSFMDAQLGKVMNALNRSGLRDKTIVVLWGDHGYHLGEHGIFCKITNFEDATRVPLMISVPEVQTPISSALVEHLDVYPTLVELAGLPSRGDALEGKSLVSLLRIEEDEDVLSVPSYAFSQISRLNATNLTNSKMGITMRTEKYRYTEWLNFDGVNVALIGSVAVLPELYMHDVNEDVNDFDATENVNVALYKENEELVMEIHELLKKSWNTQK